MAKQPTYITIFPSITATDKPKQFNLLEVLESIKSSSNPFKYIINEIKKAGHDEANNLKLALPPICFSGTFSSRTDSNLIQYSQLVCIDVDEVADIKSFKSEMKGIPFVYSCFVSPSGKGLKVLVFHDCSDYARHGDIYKLIGEKLELTTRSDLKFDTLCSNLSRACFFSFDPKLVINPNAETVKIDLAKLKARSTPSSTFSSHDTLSRVKECPIPTDYNSYKKYKDSMVHEIEAFERFYSFYPGVRNRNLNILACKLMSKGYPEELVLPFLELYYGGSHNDFTVNDIERCVKSIYKYLPL